MCRNDSPLLSSPPTPSSMLKASTSGRYSKPPVGSRQPPPKSGCLSNKYQRRHEGGMKHRFVFVPVMEGHQHGPDQDVLQSCICRLDRAVCACDMISSKHTEHKGDWCHKKHSLESMQAFLNGFRIGIIRQVWALAHTGKKWIIRFL